MLSYNLVGERHHKHESIWNNLQSPARNNEDKERREIENGSIMVTTISNRDTEELNEK
jgi:hypothetical protein